MSLVSRIIDRALGRQPRSYPSAPRIDPAVELPFLNEQIKAYNTTLRMRQTSLFDNYTAETVEMRNAYRRASLAEPAIKAALIGKIGNVMSLGLNVAPAGLTPADKLIAKFCKDTVVQSSGGVPDVVWSILSGGLIDGHSVAEKVFTRYTHGEHAGRVGLLKLKAKDTKYIQFEVDPFRNVTGVYSMRGNSGTMFPPSDFVLFNHLSLFDSPWGTSDLRASYRAAEMLPAVIKLRQIFLDKYAGPFIKGKYTDATMQASMMQELAKARAMGFITLPKDGSDIEVLDLATRGTSDFQQALDDLRKEIAIGISGAFLHMLTSNSNDRGDSQIQQDTVDIFVWMLSVRVAQCLNEQLFPELVEYNFGAQFGVPRATLEAPNHATVKAELEVAQTLHSMDVPLSLEELYERSGWNPPKDEKDKLVAQQGGMGGGPGFPPTTPPGGNGGPGVPGGHPPTTPPDADGNEDDPLVKFSENNFSGVVTDSLGRKYHYENGKRVPSGDASHDASTPDHSQHAATAKKLAANPPEDFWSAKAIESAHEVLSHKARETTTNPLKGLKQAARDFSYMDDVGLQLRGISKAAKTLHQDPEAGPVLKSAQAQRHEVMQKLGQNASKHVAALVDGLPDGPKLGDHDPKSIANAMHIDKETLDSPIGKAFKLLAAKSQNVEMPDGSLLVAPTEATKKLWGAVTQGHVIPKAKDNARALWNSIGGDAEDTHRHVHGDVWVTNDGGSEFKLVAKKGGS